MKGHGQKLTQKQETLIAALLTEPTYAKAAAKAGISEATLHRWLALPAFQEAFRTARRQVFQTAIARLQRLAARAVTTLARGLKAPRPADSIRAADLLLQHGRAALELEDLAQRVQNLEELLAQKEGKS
ncbi:MAG TPA: hypothetical protein VEL76_28800 [Gemmataceae bacterium]|nr:hypothetical protein [Gemmataceae bacterium]